MSLGKYIVVSPLESVEIPVRRYSMTEDLNRVWLCSSPDTLLEASIDFCSEVPLVASKVVVQ